MSKTEQRVRDVLYEEVESLEEKMNELKQQNEETATKTAAQLEQIVSLLGELKKKEDDEA